MHKMEGIIDERTKSFIRFRKEKLLEEKKLIELSQNGKLAEEKLKEVGPSLSVKERNVLKREIEAGTEAAEKLLIQYIPGVRGVANKYKFRLRSLEVEDLMQIGLLTLYKHIFSFDLTQDNTILTYAYRGISNEMFKYLKKYNYAFDYDILDETFKMTSSLSRPNDDYLSFNNNQYDKVGENVHVLHRDFQEAIDKDQPKGQIICRCSYIKKDKRTVYELRSKSLTLLGDKNRSIRFLQSEKEYYYNLYHACFICYLVNKLGYENSFILTHRYALFGNSIEYSIKNVGKLINRSERYVNTRLNIILKQIEKDIRISRYIKNYNYEKHLFIKKDIVLSYFNSKEQRIIRAYNGINSTGTKTNVEEISIKEQISIEEIKSLIKDFDKKLNNLIF